MKGICIEEGGTVPGTVYLRRSETISNMWEIAAIMEVLVRKSGSDRHVLISAEQDGHLLVGGGIIR
jgi:hypothetical protein